MNEESKDCTRLPVVCFRGIDPDGGEGFVGAKWPDAFGEACIVEPLCRLTDAQALLAEKDAENKALEQDYLRIISAQDEKHRQQVAQLRQHKTEYMEAAEQTRKALEARIAELEAPMLEWAELDYTKHTRRSLMCYIGQQNFKITAQAKRIASLESHIRTDNSETLVNALAEVERLKKTVAHWQGLAVANRDVADKALAQLEQLQAAPAERGVVLPERMETEAFTTIDKGSKNYKAGWNRALDEVARLNPAPATAEQAWIPVGARLPYPDQVVALMNDDVWMNTGADGFDCNWHGAGYLVNSAPRPYWNVFGETRAQCLDAATHWMPLPAAPATSDTNNQQPANGEDYR